MTNKIAYLFADQNASVDAEQTAQNDAQDKGLSLRYALADFAEAVLDLAQFLLVGALLIGLPMAFFLTMLAAPIAGSTYAEWFAAEYLRFVQYPVAVLAPIVVLFPLTKAVLRLIKNRHQASV